MKNLKRAFLPVTVACSAAVVGIALRTLAYFFAYDPVIAYFKTGNVFTTAWTALTFALIAFLATSAILNAKTFRKKTPKAAECTASARASSIIACAASLLATVYFITKAMSTGANWIAYVGAITSIVSAYHFIMLMSLERKNEVALLLTGYVHPISLALLIADMYFDMTITANNPDKIAFICSLVLLMLVRVLELRDLLGKSKPALGISVSALEIFVGASASVSYVIAVFSGLYARIVMPCAALVILAMTLSTLLGVIGRARSLDAADGGNEYEKPLAEDTPDGEIANDDKPQEQTDDASEQQV